MSNRHTIPFRSERLGASYGACSCCIIPLPGPVRIHSHATCFPGKLIRLYAMTTQPPIANNVVWHHATVTRQRREQQNGHRGAIIWFTGLSGAGKSTLAHAVEEALHQRGCRTFVLDGDNVRHGLCQDLGFSTADRVENIRRVGEVAKLFMEAGVIVLTAFISPFRGDRNKVRAMVQPGEFVEIYCQCPVEVRSE